MEEALAAIKDRMKHVVGKRASVDQHRLCRVVLTAAVALQLSHLSAAAQIGLSDVPAPPVDARIDPFPFDPPRAIRSYLRTVLPGGWWTNEPQFSLGAFTVTVHIPDGWRGNPTSAMMRLCPPSSSGIWASVERIEFQPFYRNAPWAGAICRKD